MVMSKEDTMKCTLRAMSLVLTLAILAGCQTTNGEEAIEPSTAAEPPSTSATTAHAVTTGATEPPAGFVLLAIGDSIPYNSPDDCPGCIGFVDSYGAALEAELGEPVTVLNRSRHDGARTGHIQEQLQSDDALLGELAGADVVLVSVGFNDGPPFVEPHDGCPAPLGDTAGVPDYAEAGAATTPECIDMVLQVVRAQAAGVFGSIRDVAPEAVVAALTPYDAWRGWPELDEVDPSGLYDAVTYFLQTWRPALCEEAAANSAVCVDVYTAFNGPHGTEPPRAYLAPDHAHPSQTGNDRIRDLLVEANLTDLLEQEHPAERRYGRRLS
jgi:lysophospholipase L1-like esterase